MLHSVLAWLSSPAPDDPRDELAPLRQHLREVVDTSVEPQQRLKLVELFQHRIDAVSAALKPALLEASLPLPARVRSIGPGLMDIHGLAAFAILKSLREIAPDQLSSPGQQIAKFCGQAIRNLSEQQQAALFIATTTPNGLWAHLQDLISILREAEGAETSAVEKLLKHILAMAAVQPESFSARELGFLADYLDDYATAVEITTEPNGPLEHWYWMEDGRDLPPMAVSRRPPPNRGPQLFFSCSVLSRIAGQHLLQLAAGNTPDRLSLPVADAESYREPLARAQKHWARAPLRHSHRRPAHYRVKICAGLPAVWNLLGGDSGGSITVPPSIGEWMVLNESPGGYALMHVAGSADTLMPGEMLGLRLDANHPWSIGLIRWVRSDNPEHLELGLEMISPSATAVRIVRKTANAGDFVPALLFPSVSGIDRDETLMTARGMTGLGEFLLIRETGGKLQLTQCEMGDSTLQTTKVEAFEFRRNFAPE